METKRHGLSEREMKLVELLMADCQRGDIQAKLKRLFAAQFKKCLKLRCMNICVTRKILCQAATPAIVEAVMEQRPQLVITANVKLLFLVTATSNLSRK